MLQRKDEHAGNPRALMASWQDLSVSSSGGPLLSPVLLTPVPIEHLREAAEEFGHRCDAAFGSDAYEMMRGLESGLAIFIYASHRDEEAVPVASWFARFDRWTEDARTVRTKRARWSAASDSPFVGYYVASGPRLLDEPISLGAFRRTDRTPLKMSVVRGPTVCLLPADVFDRPELN